MSIPTIRSLPNNWQSINSSVIESHESLMRNNPKCHQNPRPREAKSTIEAIRKHKQDAWNPLTNPPIPLQQFAKEDHLKVTNQLNGPSPIPFSSQRTNNRNDEPFPDYLPKQINLRDRQKRLIAVNPKKKNIWDRRNRSRLPKRQTATTPNKRRSNGTESTPLDRPPTHEQTRTHILAITTPSSGSTSVLLSSSRSRRSEKISG